MRALKRGLEGRVDALEAATDNVKGWVRIICRDGQTEADAIAAYEAEHGSVEGLNLILRSYVCA